MEFLKFVIKGTLQTTYFCNKKVFVCVYIFIYAYIYIEVESTKILILIVTTYIQMWWNNEEIIFIKVYLVLSFVYTKF